MARPFSIRDNWIADPPGLTAFGLFRLRFGKALELQPGFEFFRQGFKQQGFAAGNPADRQRTTICPKMRAQHFVNEQTGGDLIIDAAQLFLQIAQGSEIILHATHR